MSKIRATSLALLLLAAAISTAVVLAQDTIASLMPAYQNINVGDQAIVTFHVEDVQGLYGYQANITFDPSVVQVVDADPGTPGVQVAVLNTFLQPDNIVVNTVNNAAGTIMCTVMQISPTLPVSGSGDLFSITFQGAANGLSDVNFTTLSLFDQSGDPITATVHSAQVDVGNTATPTPTPTESPTVEPTPSPTPTGGDMGNLLKGIAVDPVRNLVYVAVQSDDTVAIVDGATHTLTNKVPCGGSAPNSLALSEDGSKLFVVNGGSNQVAVLDANDNYNLLTTINVGRKPFGIAIANSMAYVTNFDDGTVSIIDVNALNVVNTVGVGWHPALPAATGDHAYIPNHSAYTGWRKGATAEWEYVQKNKGRDTGVTIVYADGHTESVLTEYVGFFAAAVDEAHGRIYITKRDGTAEGLYVLDATDHTLIKFVPMLRPYSVAVNPLTEHVFVVQGDMDEIYVLDGGNDYRMIRAINTDPNNGDIPGMHGGQGIGVNGDQVFVSNYAAGTLTVVADPDPGNNFGVPMDTDYIRGWQEAGGNHGPLGAPVAPAFTYWYSEQQYERGIMQWRQVPTGTNQIYVLDTESTHTGGTDWMGRDSGIWDQFDDGWSPGMPLFPEGCDDAWWPYGPMFGFGVTWCNEDATRGRVKEVIGYPIGWEYGSIGGDQAFENGLVFWNPASDAYYVLRTDNHRWQYYRAHRRYERELAPNVTGHVQLQGRTDAGGVVLLGENGMRIATDEQGRFGFHYEGRVTVRIHRAGYLDVVATLKAAPDAHLDLGEITLTGGDVNGDNRIDILDISYVGYHFGSADAGADINGDGKVDILDLSLVGANFGQAGPISWQR